MIGANYDASKLGAPINVFARYEKDGLQLARELKKSFLEYQFQKIPGSGGVYALCDLDEIPIYIGDSKDAMEIGIRRHVSAARSGAIACRQIDVWEIAFVWMWPVEDESEVLTLADHLRASLNCSKNLVNGRSHHGSNFLSFPVPKRIRVQVMPNDLIDARKDPTLRFPRQIQHFNQLVDYILNTQDKPHLRRALEVYYNRLSLYYRAFLAGPKKLKTKKHS